MTVTDPASAATARLENDWYAALPGATAATVRVPNGVARVTSAGMSPVFVARTATYAVPARQRALVSTTSAGPASSSRWSVTRSTTRCDPVAYVVTVSDVGVTSRSE